MEYTKVLAGPNGGEVVEMTPEEIAEFQAFQEAEANRPPTPAELAKAIKELVANLDDEVMYNYLDKIGGIGQLIAENNMVKAVGMIMRLAANVNASDDDAAKAALAPVVQLLTDAGVITNVGK